MKNEIRLVRLTLEGFRSFVQRQTIPFPQKGATLITGKWKGMDVSSGSGKSSILIAIAFVLGFAGKPATRLKSWYSKKFFVELVLTDGITTWTVTRDPKLRFSDGTKEYEGTPAEEQLTALLKTNPDLAKLLTYRAQRKPGSFLNSTDAEIKENLNQVLSLKGVESGYEQANRDLTAMMTKKVSLEGELSGITSMLETCIFKEEELDAAKQEYEKSLARVSELTVNSEEKTALVDRLTKLNEYMQKISATSRARSRAEYENEQLKPKALGLKGTIEELKSAKCPTCKREWTEHQETLESCKTQLQEIVKKYEENLAIIKNSQPIIEAEPKVQAQIREINEKLTAMGAPLDDAMRAMNASKHNYKTILGKADTKKKMEDKRATLVAAIQENDRKIFQTKHVVSILGRNGFQGAIFDEVLREVEVRSNEMISFIPNISMYTLKIRSTATTKDGKVNKSINSRIYRDGMETQVDDSSGGQACGLELVGDLAYAESVRKRCSSPLGWICLDEAMDGLDVGPKRAALEVIKSKIGGQIIVIDHATEVKEGFESVIEVEYDGRESRVVSVE